MIHDSWWFIVALYWDNVSSFYPWSVLYGTMRSNNKAGNSIEMLSLSSCTHGSHPDLKISSRYFLSCKQFAFTPEDLDGSGYELGSSGFGSGDWSEQGNSGYHVWKWVPTGFNVKVGFRFSQFSFGTGSKFVKCLDLLISESDKSSYQIFSPILSSTTPLNLDLNPRLSILRYLWFWWVTYNIAEIIFCYCTDCNRTNTHYLPK